MRKQLIGRHGGATTTPALGNRPQQTPANTPPETRDNIPNSVQTALMQYGANHTQAAPPPNRDIEGEIMRRGNFLGRRQRTSSPSVQDTQAPMTRETQPVQNPPPQAAQTPPLRDPNGPANTAWGAGQHVAVSDRSVRKFTDAGARLNQALTLTRKNPGEYLTIFKNTASEYDEKLYDDLTAAMNAVRDIASGNDPDNVKGMILPGYCQRAYDAALYCKARYGHQDTSGLDRLMEDMDEAKTLFASWQNFEGDLHLQGKGYASVGESGGNDLSVHKAQKRGIGAEKTDKYFRPQADKISGIQGVAGIENDGADSVKRETAFYLLSEYLQTGLAVPTREGTRTDDKGNTVKGAVLNGAKGRTGFDYNYRYMGINDYGAPQGDSQKPAHSGGELIYNDDNKRTLGERMRDAGADLGVKTTSMAHQMGNVTGKEIKGGTVNALDPHFLRDLNRLNLLDILAGHPDRHMGNFLIDADENGQYKNMTAIDNDAVFGSRDDKTFVHQAGTKQNNQTGIKAGMRMDKELTDRILNTKTEDLQRIFADHLSEKEIAALGERFDSLSGIIRANQELQEKSGKKLLLSESDWENGDMEELVKEEMSLSKGSGIRVGDEAGNSYISRFMFAAQAWDENERDMTAELAKQKKAAEDAPALNMDENTEAEALDAFITGRDHLGNISNKNIGKSANWDSLSDEEKKAAKNDEDKRMRGLYDQYEARIAADIRLHGLESVQNRFGQMESLPEDNRTKAKNRVQNVYKDKILNAAKKATFHGKKGGFTATDPNNY